MGVFTKNGAATLYYDNASKLATTSTGVDVTGTVTADQLDAEGSGVLLKAGATNSVDRDVLTLGWVGGVGDYIDFNVPSADDESGTVRFGSNGNVYFYEDTGTTAKFFWNASAERLGIGTTSPSADLHVEANGSNIARFGDDFGNNVALTIENDTGIAKIRYDQASDGTANSTLASLQAQVKRCVSTPAVVLVLVLVVRLQNSMLQMEDRQYKARTQMDTQELLSKTVVLS